MSAKKAPNALQRTRGQKSETNNHEGNQTMTILADTPDARKFSTRFDLRTRNTRVEVQSERDYSAEDVDLVRLTDDQEAHLLLSPAEALSVAAALQAVATHLLEDQPHHRSITRQTAPGQPEHDGVGGGL